MFKTKAKKIPTIFSSSSEETPVGPITSKKGTVSSSSSEVVINTPKKNKPKIIILSSSSEETRVKTPRNRKVSPSSSTEVIIKTQRKLSSSSSSSEVIIIKTPRSKNKHLDTSLSSSSEHKNRSKSRTRSSSEEEIKSFTLEGDQPRHLKAILDILGQFKFCLDTSPLGSGKTFTAMGVARDLKLPHIIYITNASLLPKPQRIFKEHGFNTDLFITFETLRSSITKTSVLGKFRKLNHNLLKRQDTSHDEKKNITTYEVTKKFKEYVQEGCLLILDEVQALKNVSKQLLACIELEKYIIESDSKSVVLELSGSPGSKEPHFFNMLRRFQIIKETLLYENKRGIFTPLGAEELRRFCLKLDKETTNNIMGEGFNVANVESKCFKLYIDIIQFYISDSMPQPPPKPGVELIIKNGFYQMHRKEIPLIEAEIKKFAKVLGFNHKTQRIDRPIRNIFSGEITTCLVRIEICKTNLFIRLAKQVLDSNPNAKVCLALNYKETMKRVRDSLKDYGVVTVWGGDPDTKKSVDVETRQKYIDRFNEPNNKIRVLIGTLSIISQGIDLDDKNGNYPRTAFESSSFLFMHCHQFTRRFLRGSYTKSSSNVRFVYANCAEKEESILNALYKQGNVCKLTLAKQVEGGVKFPGEYENEEEEKFHVNRGEYNIAGLLSNASNIAADELD